jgi:hypothetical protein
MHDRQRLLLRISPDARGWSGVLCARVQHRMQRVQETVQTRSWRCAERCCVGSLPNVQSPMSLLQVQEYLEHACVEQPLQACDQYVSVPDSLNGRDA